MADSQAKPKLEDLNLTKDEVSRIEKALKDAEFRKMFQEYAEEISNPENKARYEAEIAQMENERGMDVQFIHPKPGYTFKIVVCDEGTKAFVNICHNETLGKPTCDGKTDNSGRRGLMWSIPHSFAPPREDIDRHKNRCKVFDVVFHPDTLHMAKSNKAFKNMIESTAIDGIVSQFGIALDKNTIKYLKMEFKGTPQATVIRTKNATESTAKLCEEDDILKDLPYPYENMTTEEKTQKNLEERAKKAAQKTDQESVNTKKENCSATPTYQIVHQSDMDFQNYTNSSDTKSTRPKNLIVSIDLPQLNSAKNIDLDVFEKSLTLKSEHPAKYDLHIDLPYPIDDNNSKAKFDKSKHQLVVTLVVIQDFEPSLLHCDEGNVTFKKDENSENSLIEIINPPVIENSTDTPINENTDNIESENDLTATLHEEKPEDQEHLESCGGEIDNLFNAKDIWAEIEDVPDKDAVHHPVAIKYTLPNYNYQQDNETISVVMQVKNVYHSSITRSYGLEEACQTACFKFLSIGSGGFPIHYCLYIKFPENCQFVPAQTTIDVSDDNVCAVLLKSKKSRETLWGKMEVGIDAQHLEEKSFPTDEVLRQEYEALVALCQQPVVQPPELVINDRIPPLMKVNGGEERDEKFMIQIGSNDVNDALEEAEWIVDTEGDDLLTGSIEVVHKHKVPALHGILKSRSLSESSVEEYSSGRVTRENSNSSEASSEHSPRSFESCNSDDPERLRRSVSFSEHIDTTTYKPSAAVTTMTVTLKSKRRRQRKRERRQQNPRHPSTGSEYSSDDYDARSNTIPNLCNSDNDDAFAPKSNATATPTTSFTINTTTPNSTTENPLNEVSESIAEAVNLKSAAESNVEEKNSARVDTDTVLPPDYVVDSLASTSSANNPAVIANTSEEIAEAAECIDSDELSEAEDISKSETPTTSADTVLSWEDNRNVSSEHRTQCAFDFSNSVMFDLDDD